MLRKGPHCMYLRNQGKSTLWIKGRVGLIIKLFSRLIAWDYFSLEGHTHFYNRIQKKSWVGQKQLPEETTIQKYNSFLALYSFLSICVFAKYYRNPRLTLDQKEMKEAKNIHSKTFLPHPSRLKMVTNLSMLFQLSVFKNTDCLILFFKLKYSWFKVLY